MTIAGKRTHANLKPPKQRSPDWRCAAAPAGLRALAPALIILGLAGCRTLPQVPITTPKPLEVNLNMRLDIYQYRGDEPPDAQATKNASEATQRMRNRMAEVQALKNNQLVGEDHRGLLQIREVPAGDWGPQMKKTVAAENADRTLLMRQKAKESNRALHEVEAEQWKLRAQQANSGEWIEVLGASPGSFEWKRAGAPGTSLHAPPVPAPLSPSSGAPAAPSSPPTSPTTPAPPRP